MKIFSGGPSYHVWAVIFCILSFLIANLGLNAIIGWSMPVLMFLYPLAIVLILLTLGGRLFGNSRKVLRWTIGFTAAAAVFDFLRALPEGARSIFHVNGVVELAGRILPLSDSGFGWVCPAAAGLMIGLVTYWMERKKKTA